MQKLLSNFLTYLISFYFIIVLNIIYLNILNLYIIMHYLLNTYFYKHIYLSVSPVKNTFKMYLEYINMYLNI